MIIDERAKRASHSQVCLIENRNIYIVSVHVENCLPVARVEIIQYSQYQKLLRSYDLEDRKHESARATHVK